ncbi:MAG: PorV/PorQ family protein [candidate division Zixibacteria bacterium]|nr:PorV/PorQ family protein [candidate division Zixibacteria bacterium]
MSVLRTIITSGLIVLAAGVSVANDGVAMLKNDHGARPSGMGAAFVSISGDPNCSAYNPAGPVGLSKFTTSFGHTEHWENIRLESGFFGINLSSRLWLHGGIRYAADAELEQRGIVPTEDPEAVFDAHDMSFKAGVAYRVSEKLAAGVAMGWFLEEIGGYRGSAFNVDIGAMATLSDRVNAGASITNLGSSFNLTKAGLRGSRDIPLPTTYRLGASYRYSYWLGAADIVYLDDDLHLHLGAEAELKEMFHLRTGYMAGYDTKNFTAGASFTVHDVTIDYAFVPFTSNLGTSHLFNLTFSL